MNGELYLITKGEALDSLPSGDVVHVFMNPDGILIGADWSRLEIEKLIDTAEQLSIGGRQCVALKHGLAAYKNRRYYFIESSLGQSKEAWDENPIPK